MLIVTDINDTEKPGHLVGRVLRADTNTILTYEQVALDGADEKENKAIVEKFKKTLETKAASYKTRLLAVQKNQKASEAVNQG